MTERGGRASDASARVTRWRGEAAVLLRSAGTQTVWLPEVGMLGASLEHEGVEFVALPGGPRAVRAGHTAGIPLLAPWANRLSAWRYRVGRTDVDLAGLPLPTDGNGLPIHGALVGHPGWTLRRIDARGGAASLAARFDAAAAPEVMAAFPFPHTLDVTIIVRPRTLRVATTLRATGRRTVPVSFGWHPYLRVPGRRPTWRLELPAAEHHALDARGIPTGEVTRQAHSNEVIGARTYDDLFRLDGSRRLALHGDGASLVARFDRAAPWAQVWVPSGRPFAALEPMTAPTDAIVTGTHPVVPPGGAFTTAFTLTVTGC